jgi:diaminohydroxyphosphoribosylaminopyrimidine deaminase/5-amino-6-(5-phosphoribosylamino)uracil reductase
MSLDSTDKNFMQIAVDLAKKGAGKVSPNPLVGALIVKDGSIIGEGFHAKFGGNHAEVNAIGNNSVIDSTMYVTLEPCNHYGKTPPCTERIIAEKIQRVIVGSIDPNPRMQGKGIECLKMHDIDVSVGILNSETEELIRFYAYWKNTGYPFVTVKLAVSGDGFIAGIDGQSKWISSLESRVEVHQMRAEYDAVLVGTNTLLLDNPALTVRHVTGRNPNRIVIDRRGRAKNTMRVFADNADRIFYFSTIRRKDIPTRVTQISLNENEFNLSLILKILGENEQQSILMEGGAKLATSLIEKNLCNEIILYQAQKDFYNGISFNESLIPKYGFQIFDRSQSGIDKKITYRRAYV